MERKESNRETVARQREDRECFAISVESVKKDQRNGIILSLKSHKKFYQE